MITKTKRFDDPSGIVSKFIFEDDNTIAETVVYRYADRGVICFSVQSGCKIGCAFCGTGKTFIRDLTKEEMCLQIDTGLELLDGCDKIQLMSMSMGEPLHNFENIPVIEYLEKDYYFFISSVFPNDGYSPLNLLPIAEKYPKFGVQCSLHHWSEGSRYKLLGSYSNLYKISEIKEFSCMYYEKCNRPMYFNYIAKGNEEEDNIKDLCDIVEHGHITVSVLCPKEFKAGDPTNAKRVASMILDYKPTQPIKLFDPAGQDTIGGGCGQLLYVQEKFKELNI